MSIVKFPDGLTVKELKALVQDWPEENEDGEDTEVWVMTGPTTSSPVTSVVTLNERRSDDGSQQWSDMLLRAKQ